MGRDGADSRYLQCAGIRGQRVSVRVERARGRRRAARFACSHQAAPRPHNRVCACLLDMRVRAKRSHSRTPAGVRIMGAASYLLLLCRRPLSPTLQMPPDDPLAARHRHRQNPAHYEQFSGPICPTLPVNANRIGCCKLSRWGLEEPWNSPIRAFQCAGYRRLMKNRTICI